MSPFRLPLSLAILAIAACAPSEGEPVNLSWSAVELACDPDLASASWVLPDPMPVAVLVREHGDDYTGYNQQLVARSDGSVVVQCGADVTLTYAQVIE